MIPQHTSKKMMMVAVVMKGRKYRYAECSNGICGVQECLLDCLCGGVRLNEAGSTLLVGAARKAGIKLDGCGDIRFHFSFSQEKGYIPPLPRQHAHTVFCGQ